VLFDAVDVENVAAVAIDSLGAVVHEPAEVVALGPFSHKLVGGQVGKSLCQVSLRCHFSGPPGQVVRMVLLGWSRLIPICRPKSGGWSVVGSSRVGDPTLQHEHTSTRGPEYILS
jgi:hypothetical protein